MKKKIYCLVLIYALYIPAFAIQEADVQKDTKKPAAKTQLQGTLKKNEVYSPANSIELKKNATAGVEVITSDEIENQGSPVISNLLNQMTGVSVQRSGSIGDVTSFRIRGTDRVRVTIDGVRADSPRNNAFYLNDTLSDDIERIEVVRGPQGNFSGAQASGGLVGMFTRRGHGEPDLQIQSDFGNLGTFKERIMYGGSDEKKDYYLGVTFLKTDGGARIQRPDGGLSDVNNDYYRNFSVVGNYGYKLWDDKEQLRQIIRLTNAQKGVGVNGWGDTLIQDNNDYSKQLSFMSTSIFDIKPNDWYDSSTRFGLYADKYNFYQFQDPDDPLGLNDLYDSTTDKRSTRLNLVSQHNFRYKDWNTFSLGYNMEYSKYKSDTSDGGYTYWGWYTPPADYSFDGSMFQNDVYASDSINIKDIFFLKGGARMVANNMFGTYVTPNASAAIVLPTFKIKNSYSKLRGSWGQSVNAPTFEQMFGYIPGMQNPNENLGAEHLTGWDVGLEQSFMDEKLRFEFGYFNSKYKDYIAWDGGWPGKYINVSSAKLNGYEASATWEPNEKFKTVLNYTYTDSQDEQTGYDLVGVPRNRINGTLYYTPNERLTLFTSVEGATDRVYTGDKRVGGYVDVALGGKVKLFSYKKMNVYLQGQVYNLLNQKITMYKGYYQPGIHFRLGLFVDFRGLGEKI